MKRIILILASIIICGSTVFAQSNHWSLDNPGAYASHLNTWIAVELDGVRLASTDIELAAFVDGECRGVERLAVYNPDWGYLACIQIFKDNAGDVITFKMYDHATETEYDDCSTTVTTQVAGEEMGATPMDPTVAVFTSPEPEVPTGPEYPWVPASFPSNMSIFAEIQINGVPQSGDNWEVGAFCGDQCRGDQVGTVPAPTEFGQMLSMVVYGVDGDVMNFYLYDIENQSIVGECSTTVTYVEQGNAGVVWDPLILNFITPQTFEKEINGYGNGDGNWYLIASPIGEVSPTVVTNMLSNSYDLYYFDQAQAKEWITYKDEDGATDPGFNLVSGKGYLYANKGDVNNNPNKVTLTFTGTAYAGAGVVSLTYSEANEDQNMWGWNLIGNPFAETAYIDGERDFYIMNPNGGLEIIPAADVNVTSIAPMEGIFVLAANENDNSLTFTTTAPSKNGSKLVLNLSQGHGVIDRAIVRFGEGRTLPKFQINRSSTKLYIPVDNKDYAVVRSEGAGEMPVSFKAEKNGTYTIDFSAQEVNFNYLHLIDNLTGTDVDLLQNSSYTFNAQTTDYANRFKLVFATGVNSDDVFGFFTNGNWIINNDGDAILQVIDATGRIMSNEEIHGSCSKRIDAAPGVYMLRLVKGNDVKVQKIVVK